MSRIQHQDIFDPDHFDQALSQSDNPLPIYRQAIKDAADRLAQGFRQQTPIEDLVHGRAWFVDQLLMRAWQRHFPAHDDDQLALIAVGGYGRGELHPHSDIDILILHDQDGTDSIKEAISGFLMFMWDIGLEVGHSVRSLKECVNVAKEDITVATNLMESRLLCGPESLFDKMRNRTDPRHIWPSRLFFEAKRKEQIERHLKFHDTAYNLEPNIKEGPGALRDIQMIGWVSKRHFGAETLHDLVQRDFLTEEEYQQLIECQAFLWRVRFALHLLTGRREDRLLFDYQPKLAEQFQFRDQNAAIDKQVTDAWSRPADGHRLGVELFMKQYYRTIMQLRSLNEMLLQHYQEELLLSDAEEQTTHLNRRFQIRNGFIEVTHDNIFKRYPFALLEIYLLIQQNPQIKGIRAATLRLIRSHTHLIDENFRQDIRSRTLFLEIFRQERGITYTLRSMSRFGILPAYLPAFKNIMGMMQYDLYHAYTVDQHTLFVVRNLRRFRIERFSSEFPLCSKIVQTIPKPETLYIAGLFHDIAKGRGGDHSLLGAEEVREFARRHDLSHHDAELLAWLVENHLLMSATAQHQDIDDPEVVNTFASMVADYNRLDYLYLLTVADMRATNPKIWNNWKDSLLIQLYNHTRRALQRGLENPADKDDRIREIRRAARNELLASGSSREAVQKLWEHIDDDYFMRYNVKEIVWHTNAILAMKADIQEKPLVLARSSEETGSTSIFVHAPISKDLFTKITATLDSMLLNILEARIISGNDGYSMDTYDVVEQDGTPITDPQRLRAIQDTLSRILTEERTTKPARHREAGRIVEHFSIQTDVSFSNDLRNHRTIMEVSTTDRPGLLSRIAHVLEKFDVLIQAAKISTFGSHIEDVFFLTDENMQPLQDATLLRDIKQELVEALNLEEQ